MNNPIIDEVRKIRDEHARRFNYDLSAICADIRKHQQECGRPVITLERRKDGSVGMVAETSANYRTITDNSNRND